MSWVIILLLVVWAQANGAQEMPVPPPIQWVLFQKILSFERNLHPRADEDIVIGIVYQEEFRPSLEAKEQFYAAVSARPKAKEIHFRCVALPVEKSLDLTGAMDQQPGIDLLYITPLREVDLKALAKISQAQQTITLTGVPEYVDAGLAVGLGTKDNKPLILINLPAAKAEGADFTAQLLKVAKVTR